MIKFSHRILLSTLLFLPTGRVLSAPAGSEYIPSREFVATAVREIEAAKTSVNLFLYLYAYRASAHDSGPGLLAQALVRAKERGVRVEVTLNGGFDPSQPSDLNGQAAEFLRAGGVDVFLSDGPLLHAKVLVVDGKTVLLGSSNWKPSAFEKNYEGNSLLRSTEAARAALKDFASMPRRAVEPPARGAIPVPAAFLEEGGAMSSMVNRGDRRSFDAYLLLLRWKAEKGSSSFIVDRKDFARAIGLPGKTFRRDNLEIKRILTKLEKVSGLILVTEKKGEDPVVSVLDVPGRAVPLPAAYMDWGWDRRLSLNGKVFYLVGLYESAVSPLSPRWSEDQITLAERHGVRNDYLIRGVTELRRAGLLEVEYSPLTMHAGPRAPNVYTNLPFYDPAELEARFLALEKTHGPEALERGRSIAALVYDDWDARLVERFILYERKHGRERMDEALEIIRAKKGDNPRRSAGYLVGILEKMERGGPATED